jgi:ABC-type Na+ transport system ATPase subunit NatA
VAEYSGGMKRRLSVAISLIGDPKVLIFTHLTRIQEIACVSCTVRNINTFLNSCRRLCIWSIF